MPIENEQCQSSNTISVLENSLLKRPLKDWKIDKTQLFYDLQTIKTLGGPDWKAYATVVWICQTAGLEPVRDFKCF